MKPVLLIAGALLIRAGAPLLRRRPAWERLLASGYARYGGRKAALKVKADRLGRRPAGVALVAAGLACVVAGLTS